MSVATEKITKYSGFQLHTVKTEKFKTNTIVVKWRTPITKENATHRALLPYVMQNSTKKYPSTAKLRSYVEELYGATFFIDLAKKGEYHIVSFSLEIANEKFLSDPTPLLKKGLEFLAEVIFQPNVSENGFDQNVIENEKRALKQRIQSIYDDKMRYSNQRVIDVMCEDEPYALSVYGEKDEVDSITPQSLYSYYKKALTEDQIDLYMVGDIQEEEVDAYIEELFPFKERTVKSIDRRTPHEAREVKEVREVQDIKQGKLNMGFRTNVVYGDPEYFALQVLNGIYGGFSHSKLFINVREKESLAYYAASRLESHKGLLLVMSGIDNQNYDKAVKIIKEQMELMKKGEFSDQEIMQTKAVIHNQMLETLDTSRGMIELFYHNGVSDKYVEMGEWLHIMSKVSREEIIEAAKKIELDTIYFLTGSEGNA
ncbi:MULTISPECIES: EF-P 5-aminopentanol modification-associated protein YfmF [Niallia]|uniref:Insulinase family protein n=1 Tax=Niallia circulans TaxID=1397 RepID=A0A941JJR3_NIACI|nr:MULTISPECIES: pitrilysin family protein [Niallia]MCB5235430.1 insulinase family protein [Niallia circulans]MED3794632.1 pitrilysin family protein [Niallia alba]